MGQGEVRLVCWRGRGSHGNEYSRDGRFVRSYTAGGTGNVQFVRGRERGLGGMIVG
ncbi:hypothetical protein GGR26_002892 [Lewinella marina]|nr:hypothetical protein [Neolewinella marina]